jgi:hypothetical protein
MTPPPMHVDHVVLKRAAEAFAAQDGQLAAAVLKLLAQIDDLGDIFGDDDEGRQAKQGFTRARDNLSGYCAALCSAYGSVGDDLALMNADVKVTDWDIISALPKVDASTVPRFGP